MKKVFRNEVDFPEIFNYAKDKFKVEWNRANNMFFGHSLDYKSYNNFYVGEDHIDTTKTFEELSESDKGYYIINQFMIDNKIDEMRVYNN